MLLLQEQKVHRVLGEVCFEALDQTRPSALDTAGKIASDVLTLFHVDTEDWGAGSPDAEWAIPLFRADAPLFHLKNRRTFGSYRLLTLLGNPSSPSCLNVLG